MLPLVQTFRDFREFLAAKKRKREPLRWDARGASEAVYKPRDARGLANFRAALRLAGDWGQASERVDAIEHALRARSGCTLPLPRKVVQNSDRSLTLYWEGVTVRALVDGVVVLIGGAAGVPQRTVTSDTLDLLEFQARVQIARR